MVLRIPIKEDGSAGEPQPLQPSGHSLLDAVQLDPRGNIYVSESLRNEIWVGIFRPHCPVLEPIAISAVIARTGFQRLAK